LPPNAEADRGANGNGPLFLGRYAPSLVLLAIVVADCGRYADTDLWGHVFFGNLLLHARRLIEYDPYSYAVLGHRWLRHEWLSQAIMAAAYDAAGVIGLKLWKFGCTAATIVFIAAAEGETGAPVMIQFGVLVVAAMALIPQMQFRPQLFTWALMAALIAALTRDNFGRRAPIWLAIPGFALWANLHGGFFIGVVTLGIYTAVTGLQDLIAGRGLRRGGKLAGITAAAALATIATPGGFATWRAVAISLVNPMTRQVMADWRPLIVVMAAQMRESYSGMSFFACVIGMFAATAIFVAIAPRGRDLALIAIAALMMVAAFMAVRNMALAVIATSAPLARHAGIAASRIGRRWEAARADLLESAAAVRLSPLTQGIVAALAMVLAATSGLFSNRIRAAMDYPGGAVAFMQAHDLGGNILGEFGWGEYLIWHMPPRSKIFIDGRFDLVYPPRIVTEYLDFFNARPGAARVLEAYPHDFVLMRQDAPACGFMMRRADWKLVYRDHVAMLFARAKSSAAQIPGISITGTAPPSYFP
jgi:hypothetical protein